MKDDSFCIFLYFMKAGKVSGFLEGGAELVASQLTQLNFTKTAHIDIDI